MSRITTHPGKMLEQEFLVPYKLSGRALAKLMGVPANRITQLVKGQRDMTADTARRLEIVFGMSAEFWMRLQIARDLSLTNANDYAEVSNFAEARLAA